MSDTEHRKLATTMFTDMVGQSAVAQRHEAPALELLKEHRAGRTGILHRPYFLRVKQVCWTL
jgi:hypothetical protein